MESEEQKTQEDLKEAPAAPQKNRDHLKEPHKWIRLAFMVIYFLALQVLLPVLAFLSAVQFLHVLFKSETNIPLKEVNRTLLGFFRDTLGFITYQTEKKPFPFNLETEKLQEGETATTMEARV